VRLSLIMRDAQTLDRARPHRAVLRQQPPRRDLERAPLGQQVLAPKRAADLARGGDDQIDHRLRVEQTKRRGALR